MDSEVFRFKKGKHAGRTIDWVQKNEPGYIRWAKENAPGLLKEPTPKVLTPPRRIEPPADEHTYVSPIKPNLNFENEGVSSNVLQVNATCTYCDKPYITYQQVDKGTLYSYFCTDKCEKQCHGENPESDY